jgi:outer membrane receptor protein involved in Fe transport
VHGDEIEQDDTRAVLGANAQYAVTHDVGEFRLRTRIGMQFRDDAIDNALWHDAKRARLANVVNANVQEGSLGIYAEEDVSWSKYLRLLLGARTDGFGFKVEDHNEVLGGGAVTSGVKMAGIVSPKASLIVTWPDVVDVFLNAGSGFHSNDARGVVRNLGTVTPLTRANGIELGARSRINLAPTAHLELAGSLWGEDLDGETVWVGDEGTTELSGPTRRFGFEGEGRLQITPQIFADLDVNLTRALFTQEPANANAVPLAPTLMVQGGVSARDLFGFFGRVGGVYIGDRPATEDGFIVAKGFFRLDASAGWTSRFVTLALVVENVLNTPWAEAQFATTSRLPGEGPTSCSGHSRAISDPSGFIGCEDLHFTPGSPLNAQLTASVRF